MFARTDRRATTPVRELALECLETGIEAARPARVIEESVAIDGDRLRVRDAEYDLEAFDRVVLVGGGKAAGGMAGALADVLGDRLADGVLVGTGVDGERTVADGAVTVRPGDHPTPAGRNVAATRDLLDVVDAADSETLVLAAITGGASALLSAPADDLTVESLAATTDALLASGASIDELNAVRKHCSAIKGGRLARRAAPATVLALAISDVVGDDPAVIGSGPTVPDPTTYGDALDVLARYEIADEVPTAVREHLRTGAAGEREETPSSDDPVFDRASWRCLASGRTAIDAAREVAVEAGYEPAVLSSRVRGEARAAGRFHAAVAAEVAARGEPVEAPAVLLSGGEVTVTVRGDGTGGPNQELALAAAIELAESGTEATLASVDTDGIDGPTDVAGAIVDAETVADDSGAAREALAHNDAGTFLDERDAALRTGYTGTNVNDLRVVVIPDDGSS